MSQDGASTSAQGVKTLTKSQASQVTGHFEMEDEFSYADSSASDSKTESPISPYKKWVQHAGCRRFLNYGKRNETPDCEDMTSDSIILAGMFGSMHSTALDESDVSILSRSINEARLTGSGNISGLVDSGEGSGSNLETTNSLENNIGTPEGNRAELSAEYFSLFANGSDGLKNKDDTTEMQAEIATDTANPVLQTLNPKSDYKAKKRVNNDLAGLDEKNIVHYSDRKNGHMCLRPADVLKKSTD